MALAAGTKLGPYEITAKLGEGGMGEVYRATDTKLDRQVAIKVLPEAFTQDPERLARFEREAKVLAQLHHPNIASIFGLEESGGVRALVMELVEGQTLAQRLKDGALSVDESLAIARQIAEALEEAHEKGIIHRDLKPANINVMADGRVKVLDFGLAKALDPVGLSGTALSASELAMSPTLTHDATQMGVILGTAAYMAPEQAKGQPVDKRADIWSFGVVLYEMLTGSKMFGGDTLTETLAGVLKSEIEFSRLPTNTPQAVRRLLRRCLERNPKNRLRDIGDLRLLLDDAGEDSVAGEPARPVTWLNGVLPWAIALLAALVAGWAFWGRGDQKTVPLEVVNLELGYPPDVEPVSGLGGGFAIAPDGRTVAMIGVRGGVRKLFLRRLDRTETTEIADSGGVNSVVFSPDNSSVAFIGTNTTITCLSLIDQQRKQVAAGVDLVGGLGWGLKGIYFVRDGALWTVSPQGGDPRTLTELDASRHEVMHVDPLELPGGRFVLFSSLTSEFGTERIEAVSLDDGRRSIVVERAATAIWSPTGHLLFGRDGAVMAVPLDAASATVRGAAVLVFPAGVVGTTRWGSLGLQLSGTGTLLSIPSDFEAKRVLSVGRDGAEMTVDLPTARYNSPRISPDGRRLSVERDGAVIEALDLVRGTHASLTSAARGTSFLTWTAGSERVVFRRLNVPTWAAADGSLQTGALPGGRINDYPSAPGPDPDSILVVRIQAATAGDIFLMSVRGAFPPKPLIVTPSYEGGPQLSPDGRWLLYQSNASGQAEVYVRRYPALDRVWQVSEGGGVQPRFSSDSREIYYRGGPRLMAVALDSKGAEPVFGKPQALFVDEYDFGQGLSIANYDVTTDGRFIMLRRGPQGGRLHTALYWTDELKRIVAAGGVR